MLKNYLESRAINRSGFVNSGPTGKPFRRMPVFLRQASARFYSSLEIAGDFSCFAFLAQLGGDQSSQAASGDGSNGDQS